jgi:hypothetical protein
MRLPSARTQLLAFLVPFIGVTLTLGGSGVAARRAGNSQSSRTRVNRTLRATVGQEWDALHEEPDKRWETYDPTQSYQTKLPPGPPGDGSVAAEAAPLPPPAAWSEFLPRDSAQTPPLNPPPAICRGRAPPAVS